MAVEENMDAKTFRAFAELIYAQSGIVLGPNKEALVHARMHKRMNKLGFAKFKDYLGHVRKDASGTEVVEMLNAISTNVTHFFRESKHFDLLGRWLREWSAAGQTRFRIWSAASSSGEEPYSIAITAREALADVRDVKILATDLSTKILQRAKAGVYEARNLGEVPRPLLHKYFEKDGDTYRVVDAVRALVTFGRINLARPPFPLKGPLDVVFCRNVMIYFDNEVRRRLLEGIFRLVRPGGHLLVGHSESLSGMLSRFKVVEPSVYVRP